MAGTTSFLNTYHLRAFRDHLRTSLGPKGCLKVFVSSVGQLTVTQTSERMLRSLEVTDPCVEAVMIATRGVLERYGDGGLYFATLVSDLVLAFGDHDPFTLDQCLGELAPLLEETLDKMKNKVEFGSLKDLMCVATAGLSAKSCLTQKKARDLSLPVIEAFLRSIPQEDGFHPRGSVKIRASQGLGESVQFLEGYAFPYPEASASKWSDLERPKIVILDLQLNFRPGEMSETADISLESSHDSLFVRELILKRMSRLRNFCVREGVKIVTNQKVVDPAIKGLFADKGILFLERLGTEGANALVELSGARQMVTSLDCEVISAEIHVGKLDRVTIWVRENDGLKNYLHFQRRVSTVSTLIVEHWSEETLEELKVRIILWF